MAEPSDANDGVDDRDEGGAGDITHHDPDNNQVFIISPRHYHHTCIDINLSSVFCQLWCHSPGRMSAMSSVMMPTLLSANTFVLCQQDQLLR